MSKTINVVVKQGKSSKEILYNGLDISFLISTDKALELFNRLNVTCNKFEAALELNPPEHKKIQSSLKTVQSINRIKVSGYCVFGIFENTARKSYNAVYFDSLKSSDNISELIEWLLDKLDGSFLVNPQEVYE